LEEAKRYLEKARESQDIDEKSAHRHAALMLGFCSLEAHVNAVADDFAGRRDIDLHDRAIMGEAEVKLEKGRFVLGNLKIYRLEDRIEFLCRRFGGKPVEKNSGWWPSLSTAIKLRNSLTHPKVVPDVTAEAVALALNAIIQTIDAIYQCVYGKPFPGAGRGLQSRFVF
jgi:hypothetical protein